ncbi:unnamed protein product [Trichobilharzia regenti]|nr:unnamed protein product [Trichobilharzia regenti]
MLHVYLKKVVLMKLLSQILYRMNYKKCNVIKFVQLILVHFWLKLSDVFIMMNRCHIYL